MDERSDRIIAAAIALAERDGYDAVRLRDLAAQAGVALATVYRRFSCKEDILAAALDQQVHQMNAAVSAADIPGDSGLHRLDWFFERATLALAEHPRLTAAMLRTVASGVPDLAERVMRYHGTMTALICRIYRGDDTDTFPSEQEQTLSHMLQHNWFGLLVGWTGGLHSVDEVVSQMKTATRTVLAGLEMPA